MRKKKPRDARKTLLEDLEAIHTLLSETPTSAKKKALSATAKGITPQAERDDQVPLLDDMVGNSENAENDLQPILGDDLFQALLDDNWSTATAKILEEAVTSIDQLQVEWTPILTEELVDALKIRLEETVHAWLRTALVKQAEELHGTILKALSEEIASIVERISDTQNSEGADGE